MFNFEKPEFTINDAYQHYKTDGIESRNELVLRHQPQDDIEYDLIDKIKMKQLTIVEQADEEELKAMMKKARRLELRLGICKALDGRMQRQHDYNKALEKQLYKDKDVNVKKVKPLHDYFITIAFDDKKLFDKNGNIKYKDLVKIMKAAQGYKFIKTDSDFTKFKYQIEQRGKEGEPIYGLHVHMIVRDTTKTKQDVIDAFGAKNAMLITNKYISDSSKIQVDHVKYDHFDEYLSEVNLKKISVKRSRQVNDRIIQIEYNKLVKEPMLKSIVVPQQ